jgi:4-amino-4-deoxy-L-arabinose transferase-like glycosyltransferase
MAWDRYAVITTATFLIMPLVMLFGWVGFIGIVVVAFVTLGIAAVLLGLVANYIESCNKRKVK